MVAVSGCESGAGGRGAPRAPRRGGFLTYCLTLGALRPRDVVTAFTMLSRQLSTRRI
jgi:hypothetical protein